jgi:Rho GTPase-activating protein RGD1
MVAENDDNRLRQIRLHEQVNDLPDANYATLRYFMGHLYKYGQHRVLALPAHSAPDRIVQYASHNSMSAGNLAIVFGPTLFGDFQGDGVLNGGGIMADTTLQNKVCTRHEQLG